MSGGQIESKRADGGQEGKERVGVQGEVRGAGKGEEGRERVGGQGEGRRPGGRRLERWWGVRERSGKGQGEGRERSGRGFT